MSDLSTVFKALSDDTRLRILKLLEHGELCVCDLVAACDMVQPKISFHLNVLKTAGFLKDRKNGKWMHYRLDESDLFRRHLLMSVMERMSVETSGKDTGRLAQFLKTKNGDSLSCVCTAPTATKKRRKQP